jgi:hypothetical protein
MYYSLQGSWGPVFDSKGKEIVKEHDIDLFIAMSNGVPDFNEDIKTEIDALNDAVKKITDWQTKNNDTASFSSGDVMARKYSYIFSYISISLVGDQCCPVSTKKYSTDNLEGLKALASFIKNPKDAMEIMPEKAMQQEPDMNRSLLSDDTHRATGTNVKNKKRMCC